LCFVTFVSVFCFCFSFLKIETFGCVGLLYVGVFAQLAKCFRDNCVNNLFITVILNNGELFFFQQTLVGILYERLNCNDLGTHLLKNKNKNNNFFNFFCPSQITYSDCLKHFFFHILGKWASESGSNGFKVVYLNYLIFLEVLLLQRPILFYSRTVKPKTLVFLLC
jgi:hypothetical protein